MITFLLLSMTADAATMRAAQRMVVSNPHSPEGWVELGDAYKRRLKRRRRQEHCAAVPCRALRRHSRPAPCPA